MKSLRYFELSQANAFILLFARILLIALFIIFGIPKLLHFSGTVAYFNAIHAPVPTLSALIAVAMETVAALAVILGFYTRPLAWIFVFYTLGTALIGHPYWTMQGDAVEANMINFYKNISIMGGFLLLAVVGPGRYSLDKH